MHFSTLATPLLAASIVSAACSGSKVGHRRHHTRSDASGAPVRNGKAASGALTSYYLSQGEWSGPSATASGASTAVASVASSAAASTSTSTSSSSSSNSTSSSSSSHCPTTLKKNGICIGWVPDDGKSFSSLPAATVLGGSGGGTATTQAAINAKMGSTGSAQGWYSQAQSGTAFDGSQLTSRMDEIVASGGIFQPAVMPTGGWSGLTASDNSQAVNICNVMKKFTDKGLTVWLRFGHEVNYYQTDGTYTGDAADFKAGWAAVHAACKTIAPEVKMWYTPNIASLSQYEEYMPDVSTVDIIGVDWYPESGTTSATFLSQMQPFHDKYASASTIFAQGETGLNSGATIAERLAWLEVITSTEVAAAMPHFVAVSWFNYYKGYDFRVADVSGDSVTIAFLNQS
ncbi:hypothetical protein RQP46_000854 [Phenoliferia psychrophenolica]